MPSGQFSVCGSHFFQIYFLWVPVSVVAHSLAQLFGSIQPLPFCEQGLWGTVAALCVPIRKTPSGISFPMLPSSAITSVSVSAGSPEPVPPMQTEGRREQAERCSLAELLFQLPRRAQPRPVSPAPACLSPSLRAGVWSCFGNRCHSGLTSRGFVVSLSPS